MYRNWKTTSALCILIAGCGATLDEPATPQTEGAGTSAASPPPMGANSSITNDGGQPSTQPRDTPPPMAGRSVDCIPSSQDGSETCDGKDNDCDGRIDEGFADCRPMICNGAQVAQCRTECGSGQRVCVDGSFGPCEIDQPNMEVCNRVDDDCDGMTDEDTCDMPTSGRSAQGGAPVSGQPSIAGQPSTGGAESIGGSNAAGQVSAGTPANDNLGGQMDVGGSPDRPLRCRNHLDCEMRQFCYFGQCFDGLPGDYNFEIVHARYNEDNVSDFLSDPDIYAEIRIDGNTNDGLKTPQADNRDLSSGNIARWNHTIRDVRLRRGQDFAICVYDADIGGDDLLGCVEFTTDNLVEAIRSFNPANQPAGRTLFANFRPPIPIEYQNKLTELVFSAERMIQR